MVLAVSASWLLPLGLRLLSQANWKGVDKILYQTEYISHLTSLRQGLLETHMYAVWRPFKNVLDNLRYLGAIYFHNQRPSTTPACSKTAHVTIHWKWRWSQFQGIGSVTFGPEQQEQHIRYCGGLDQIERTCHEKLLCAKATNVVHQDCEDPIWSLTGISEGAVFSGCQYDNSLDMLNVHEFSWSYFLDTT